MVAPQEELLPHSFRVPNVILSSGYSLYGEFQASCSMGFFQVFFFPSTSQ